MGKTFVNDAEYTFLQLTTSTFDWRDLNVCSSKKNPTQEKKSLSNGILLLRV